MAKLAEAAPGQLSAPGGVCAAGDEQAGLLEQRFGVQARAPSRDTEVEVDFRGGEVAQGDERVTPDEWAAKLGTISYEVVCALGPRVERRYTS